jgi:hypothetical protein
VSHVVHRGGCHCGALRYDLDWPAGEAMPARRCHCGYCTRFEGTWTSSPRASLRLRCPPDATRRYRFGTRTADFVGCARCGVVVAALGEHDGRRIAVVNVRSLDAYSTLGFVPSDSDFDAESRDERLARRARRWIGRVEVSEA